MTGSSVSQKIASMFSSISRWYDFLNTLFSLGLDSSWRKKAVRLAIQDSPRDVLDVATGTGKVAFEILRQLPAARVFCLDPSRKMLGMARENCPSGYSNSIFLISGVGEALPFKDGAFEAVTVAFGIRNFANLEQGLKEIFRILKDGGTFVALEFSMPDNPIPKFFYNLYLGYIIPLIGLLVARSKAYFYLRDTIKKFPRDHALATILKNTGFTNVEFYKYTTGIVACYRGKKRVI